MYQLADIKWKYDDKSDRYSEVMILRDVVTHDASVVSLYRSGSDKARSSSHTLGEKSYRFNFKLSEEKYCIGYFGGDGFKPCPVNAKIIKPMYTQCPTCEKLQGFKSAFLFGGEPNENAARHLAQTHYIYLAYFEHGIVKVGTAAESRKYLRPIEQDALMYVYIAENDGFNIQKLEHTISKQLGITEFVRGSHKLKTLSYKPNIEKAKKMLIDTFYKIILRFGKVTEFSTWIYPENKINIIDLSGLPEIFYPDREIFLQKDDLNLFGEFRGLRGKYLIIENNEDLIAFDIRYLIGRNIEYIDDYMYKIEYQLSFKL